MFSCNVQQKRNKKLSRPKTVLLLYEPLSKQHQRFLNDGIGGLFLLGAGILVSRSTRSGCCPWGVLLLVEICVSWQVFYATRFTKLQCSGCEQLWKIVPKSPALALQTTKKAKSKWNTYHFKELQHWRSRTGRTFRRRQFSELNTIYKDYEV